MKRTVRSAYMDIVEREALDDGSYRVTIAAKEKIRQPPELDFDGLSTENYTKNPVVMWAHDVVGRSPSGGLPIGRTSKLTTSSEGRIVAKFEFLSDDPFAQRVKNAWDKGFLQAASISWLPVEGYALGLAGVVHRGPPGRPGRFARIPSPHAQRVDRSASARWARGRESGHRGGERRGRRDPGGK